MYLIPAHFEDMNNRIMTTQTVLDTGNSTIPKIRARRPSSSPKEAPKTSRKKKASVRFHPEVAVCYWISIGDMTPQEIHQAWFSREESASILKACCRQLRKMAQGENLNEERHCIRGLETHTTTGAIAKRKARKEAIQSVLYEQDRQVVRSSFLPSAMNDEAISEAYRSVSASCQIWATVVGLQDQREAERILNDI